MTPPPLKLRKMTTPYLHVLMLTPSATTIKLYLLMQVSIAQQGGDQMYYKHTHTHTNKEN